MKTLSKKQIIIAITALIVLVAVAAVALALSMSRYEEPEQVRQVTEEQSPYGNYDYSKRAFLTAKPTGCQIYNGDVYFTTNYIQLVRVPLNEVTCDLRTSEKVRPKYYSVCPDTTHNHDSVAVDNTCPGWLIDPTSSFLIDAYESAGDFPIVYYYRCWNIDLEQDAWDQPTTYEIFRYDTGDNARKCIASVDDPIIQMMTYDQTVFFVTQSAKNTYQLNSVSKSNDLGEEPEVGKGVTTLSIGNGQITLLGEYNDQIIFRDGDGTVYKTEEGLQEYEEIVRLGKSVDKSVNEGFQGVFINGSYLYYCADYETVPYVANEAGTWILDLIKHSVRRIPLDDPQAESELVAENVYDQAIYGVTDNVFYYAPCIAAYEEEKKGYYYNFTGGLLKGVDLETLEEIEMKEDTGLFFCSVDAFVIGDALISSAFPVREGYNITHAEGYYICLYDIKTGALYPLYTTST